MDERGSAFTSEKRVKGAQKQDFSSYVCKCFTLFVALGDAFRCLFFI